MQSTENNSLNLTTEEKAMLRRFVDDAKDAELIIGKKRFVRIQKRGATAIAWSNIDDPLKTHPLMYCQYME